MAEQPKVTESLQKHLGNPSKTLNVSVCLAVNVTVEQFLLEAKTIGVTIEEVLKFPCGEPATIFIKATPAQVLQLQSSALVETLDSNDPFPYISELELIPH